jgi:hypothetical protein
MIQITVEEAKNILTIVDRVQISGKEAMAVAQLQVKLSQGIEKEAPKEEEKPKKKK